MFCFTFFYNQSLLLQSFVHINQSLKASLLRWNMQTQTTSCQRKGEQILMDTVTLDMMLRQNVSHSEFVLHLKYYAFHWSVIMIYNTEHGKTNNSSDHCKKTTEFKSEEDNCWIGSIPASCFLPSGEDGATGRSICTNGEGLGRCATGGHDRNPPRWDYASRLPEARRWRRQKKSNPRCWKPR
jgi:hypothetical protein